jgi:hypothetical protein
MIRRGSPATNSAAEAANTTGRTGPMFSAQAIIAPTYQPVADQRSAAKARFYMTGVSADPAALPLELTYSAATPIGCGGKPTSPQGTARKVACKVGRAASPVLPSPPAMTFGDA